MKGTCRVVIIDDHRTLRDLLRIELPRLSSAHYEVVGEGGTGQEAIDVCLEKKPDLLVLDLMLPGDINGAEALKKLRTRLPQLRTLIFSGCVLRPFIAQAIALGATGFVRKAQPLQALLEGMRQVEGGGRYFDTETARLVATARDKEQWQMLTVREREVVRLIAEGKSTKEVAAILGLSVKTVDKHRSRMMKKLHLHDAVAVTRYAILAGWVAL